jgi:hypothetical protein
MVQILALTVAGRPHCWLSPARAMTAKVTGRILYGFGDGELTFQGGMNARGERSLITVEPIIVLAGAALARHTNDALPLSNRLLFLRDRYLCGYCGQRFAARHLSRDHVIPRAQGGKDEWGNTVCACLPCNQRKGPRRPEEARMELLFLPYAPVREEAIILAGRNVMACQMAFLRSRLPKHSRLN